MIDYVSLNNKTSFSLMNALISPADLFKRAAELGQKAVVVSDMGSCAGIWDSLKASKKTGVKLIAGCDFYFVNDVADTEASLRHVVLLAKNAVGYRNLLLLSKKGYDNNIIMFKKAIPRIDWKLLEKHSEGLICTTSGGNGIISQLIMKRDFISAEDQIKRLQNIFGDNLAIELQPHSLKRKSSAYSGEVDQNHINIELSKLAQKLNIRCIVTTDAHYLEKEHNRALNTLLAIGSGQPFNSGARLSYNVSEFHVKSGIEVANYFLRLNKIEPLKSLWNSDFVTSLFENTIYFADQCEDPVWIDPKHTNPSGKELPEFPVRNQADYDDFKGWLKSSPSCNGLPEDAAYMRYRCELAFNDMVPVGQEAEYRARLKEELDVLEFHGFSSYMLIVADILEYARNNKIRLGVGRGSAGGSLIGYLLKIHIADPIKYNLIFARFHNKEKSSFPDLDNDVATSGRKQVQNYISKKYGEDYVAHVSNINTITPKVYARDIARTFGFGDSTRTETVKIANDVADTIPADIKTVKSAIENIPLFAAWAEQYPELTEFADTIGGSYRAWSTHAAGVVIGKRPLTGLIPLRKDKDGNVAIEYEKERAEENGLVKMDILGVEALDVISNTYKIIKSLNKPAPPDPPDFDEYDPKVYDMITAGNTFCVFQLGTSGGTIELCKKIKPKSIDDLAIINTLTRPAAADIRDDFIKTREGILSVKIEYPSLERAFKPTYGFPIYEECLLWVGLDVAGWDLNTADRLRKLTKDKGKHPEKVKQWREEFISDAQTKRNLTEKDATDIWDNIIAKFGGYAFNRSHAIFYSLLGYHTAYLKAYYPLEFLTASLMSEVNSGAKIAKENIIKIKDEIRRLGINIVPPDINTSSISYKIINDKTLMTGLNSLKYMNDDAIPELLANRPYTSFEDFLVKINGQKLGSRAIQALAASGSLDSFGISRKLMFFYAADFRKKLQVYLKKDPEKRGEFKYPWPENESEWTPREMFALEEFYCGEGMSGTMNERYEYFFVRSTTFQKYIDKYEYVELPRPHPSDLNTKEKKEAFDKRKRMRNTYPESDITGVITSVFSFKVKKEGSKLIGKTMAKLMIRDAYGMEISAVAFPSDWDAMQEVINNLSSGKNKVAPGIAINFAGSFYRESEHSCQFIIGEVGGYKAAPELPKDLKSKKVKIARAKSVKKDLKKIDKKKLAQELEDELVEDGFSNLEEDGDI
jgi:DNA polymerase-3 subunit alpha